MATIMPESEALRKAVKWISGRIEEEPSLTVNRHVRDAVARFDLSPKDAEFLMAFYHDAQTH